MEKGAQTNNEKPFTGPQIKGRNMKTICQMILHIKLVKTKQMWVIKPPVVCLRGCKDGGFVSSICSENSIFLTPVHFTTSLNLSTFSPSSNLSRDIFVWPKITNVFIIFGLFLAFALHAHARRRCQGACFQVLISWRVYTEDTKQHDSTATEKTRWKRAEYSPPLWLIHAVSYLILKAT